MTLITTKTLQIRGEWVIPVKNRIKPFIKDTMYLTCFLTGIHYGVKDSLFQEGNLLSAILDSSPWIVTYTALSERKKDNPEKFYEKLKLNHTWNALRTTAAGYVIGYLAGWIYDKL